MKMNADESYSNISNAKKREKLMALIERKRSSEPPVLKKQDDNDTNINSSVKESMKQKKLNAHFYKKKFQIGVRKLKPLSDVNDTNAEESCSGSRRKKRRLCRGKGCEEIVCQSPTKDKIESVTYATGSGELDDFQFEASTETHDHVLPYVSKLLEYRKRGENVVFFDGQDRFVKVVLFVLSMMESMKDPILIIASSRVLSLWETEFSKWSKSINVVMYKGNKETRAACRDTEFYSENGCVKFKVLLSSPDAIVEDLEMLNHIKWELLVVDECQRPIFLPHFKKFRTLLAEMKLVTVSGELGDICQSYENILSLVDSKYKKIKKAAETETHDNVNTLKERLSPFIAFECQFNIPTFEEYWVPVHLSCMQIEQYCSILSSNLEALSSSSRNSSLHDILTQIQKCCDHPFLVDPTLRDSSKTTSLIDDPLDAEINVSGKMQLLDKLLIENQRCGLRTLVLFQSAVNSEKISTGQFLDDLVHQRFGENSYVYIPEGKGLSNAKKKKSLKMFNNGENAMFVCLMDYRSCLSSITLSRVDVVILFNSVGNPSNDLKALKRITIDSHIERLNVFRLYSTFTVEEKALILAKQRTTVNYACSRVGLQMLAWGASYLFSKQKSSTDPRSSSFIDDLVHGLLSITSNTLVETGPANCSVISKAHMQDGGYSGSIVLFGETETYMKENSAVEEYLIDITPSDFWIELVKQSQLRPESSGSRLSRRVRKSPQFWFEEGYGIYASASSFVSVKPRSKRKVRKKVGRKWAGTNGLFGSQQSCENTTEESTQRDAQTDAQLPILPSANIADSTALNPMKNGSQESQTDQPAGNTSSSMPLETEIERIHKEREQIVKSHQEMKKMLLSECEKEISEVQKKYDVLIHDSETSFTKEIKVLEDYQKLVDSNKLLADILAQNWQENLHLDRPELGLKRTKTKQTNKHKQKESSPLNVPVISASALVRPKNLCLTSGPITYLPGNSLTGSGIRAPPPHLRSNPSMFSSFHNGFSNVELFLEPSPVLPTT